MDSPFCYIPVSAHIIVNADDKIVCTYEHQIVSSKVLADLLVCGFGIDTEELSDNSNHNPAA